MPTYTGPLPFQVGDVLTDYASVAVTVRRIASGGFGLVAFGPDRLWESRWRALKLMRPDVLARSPAVRDLFIREALTWRGVWPHANILQVQFVTAINGLPMLVLDYAEHGALRGHLGATLPLAQGLTWAQHIAAGLLHLHTPDPAHLRPHPIVHRDLKPENILLENTSWGLSASITDFGLAKTRAAVAAAEEEGEDLDAEATTSGSHTQRYRTRRGSALGTPAYMAPEQWEDAVSAGPPADAYAFGVILGELLTGSHPLLPLDAPHSQAEWQQAHLSGPRRPLPSVLPVPLHQLYARLLAPEPEARPPLAEAVAVLHDSARRVRLPVYTPPEVVPPTPDNQMIFWHGWATAYTRFGQNEEALVRIERAYALAPHHPAVLVSRGTILHALKRDEEALAMYAAALAALSPEDHLGRRGVLHQQGVLYHETGQYAEAEAAYAAALREQPDAADTWCNRAINQRVWGEAEQVAGQAEAARAHLLAALAHAQQAQRLNVQLQPVYGTLARIAAKLTDVQAYAEAEAGYALAGQGELGEDAPGTWFNRALNLARWGATETQAGQAEAARAHFEAALDAARQAQRLGSRDPQLPALIAAIQRALRQG